MNAGPGAALGRIIAAYQRALVNLGGFDALSAELLRPDTELALCVVLALFAGVEVPSLGPVADSIRSLKPSLNLGAAGRQLDSAIVAAVSATQDSELARAGGLLARAMEALGEEKVGLLIRSSEFSSLRAYLAPMRAGLLSGPPSDGYATPTGQTSAPATRASNLSAAWWGLGLVAGLGIALVAFGSAPKRKMTYGYG